MMRNILAGFRFLTLSIGVSSWAFAADETFSPEQLRRIQEIVQAEREKIRADLLAELEANGLLNSGVPKKREEGNAQQIAAAEESRTVTAVDLRTVVSLDVV